MNGLELVTRCRDGYAEVAEMEERLERLADPAGRIIARYADTGGGSGGSGGDKMLNAIAMREGAYKALRDRLKRHEVEKKAAYRIVKILPTAEMQAARVFYARGESLRETARITHMRRDCVKKHLDNACQLLSRVNCASIYGLLPRWYDK